MYCSDKREVFHCNQLMTRTVRIYVPGTVHVYAIFL